MKRKILLPTLVFTLLFACLIGVFSATSNSRIRGSFAPLSAWTGGHPGVVLFDTAPVGTGEMSYRDQDGYLSGNFWLGNVGWSTFNADDSGVPLCRARIVCPTDILTNTGQVCPVHGCAWSENAGWIVLSGSMLSGSTYTGVYYNPSTALIEGFGWSRALGWVPFYAKTDNQELGIDPLTQTGISMDGLSVHFVGKIAIIGNIAGTRIYELPNQNVGYVFSMASQATMMNTIRKNIALISRNITDITLANPTSSLNFLVEKTTDYIMDFGATWPVNKRTIVVIGHDIILDTINDIGVDDGTVRGLIALKDASGNGGNIIISEKVKRIYALIYAEGSIFSGEKTSTGYIDHYLSHSAFNIPQKQLYIKGLLISKNTISGARQVPIKCPVIVSNCDQTTAELYDLNYFRTFDPTDPAQRAVPYSDPRLDTASMVIEYNDAIMTDPPPGLENTIQ